MPPQSWQLRNPLNHSLVTSIVVPVVSCPRCTAKPEGVLQTNSRVPAVSQANLTVKVCVTALGTFCLSSQDPPPALVLVTSSRGNPRNLHAGEEATVRIRHGTMDWFQIGKGVRQGCVLSPCLFNLYAEYIMSSAGLDAVI